MKNDAYYTNNDVVNDLILKTSNIVDFSYYNYVLEPAAGSGAFIKQIPHNNIIAYDIDPKLDGIIKQDFLKLETFPDGKILTIGNPPFGKRDSLSIEFFNHAAMVSSTIAFIIPITWRKYSVQKYLMPNFRLIYDCSLKENSFHTPDGKPYKIRTTYQIWTRDEWNMGINLRVSKDSIKLKHNDFNMYLYNATKSALKYFDMEWDFAVPRQGYNDYNIKYYKKDDCDLKKHWMLFKAHDTKSMDLLNKIDFQVLSQHNAIIPGFGKSDVINEYIKLLNNQ